MLLANSHKEVKQMSIKIGNLPFKEHVHQEVQDTFMRGAIASAQDSLRGKKLLATSSDEKLGDWEAWREAGAEIRKHTLRSEEHTSELQSRFDLVCRILLVK